MKLEITGEQMLSMVSDRLNHLLSCREFLYEFLKQKLDEKLIAEQAKEEHKFRQTQLKDAIAEYYRLCREHATATEVTSGPRSPVQLWLDDVAELEAAERLVTSDISEASGGPYGDGLPRDLNSRLRSLTKFDDSE